MSTKQHLAVLLATLTLTAAAPAATTIGSLNTAGGNGSSGHDFFGQTFTVPAGETGINSVSFIVRQGNPFAAAGTLKLYNYDEPSSSFTGSPLYSLPVIIPGPVPSNEYLLTATPNLPVIPGQTLALVLDWGTTGNSSGNVGTFYFTESYYPDGHLLFAGAAEAPVSFPNYEAPFQVQFGPIPEPATAALTLTALATLIARRRRA